MPTTAVRKRKRHKFVRGDLFAIPINPETCGHTQESATLVGQVLDDRIYTFGSMLCAFFDIDSDKYEPLLPDLKSRLIAIQYVTCGSLKSNDWGFLVHCEPIYVSDYDVRNLEADQEKGFSAIGDGVVLMLLGAWRGHIPWNLPKDATFFDRMLATGKTRPDPAYFK